MDLTVQLLFLYSLCAILTIHTEDRLLDGNITGTQVISLLSQLNEAVYASSSEVANDPFACNLNGLSQLTCKSNDATTTKVPLTDIPIRAVTASGLFAPAPWMVKHWEASKAGTKFYGQVDFDEMAAAGVNTVVLPVPLSFFESSSSRKKSNMGIEDLDAILHMVHQTSSLKAILQLIGADHVDGSVKDAIKYVVRDVKHPATILAVELPDIKYVNEARSIDRKLPLLVPIHSGQIQHLSTDSPGLADDPRVYGVLSLSHTSTVADIASSTSVDDRTKMFYHESLACMQRAPVEYTACFHNVPVLVTGFDLSIDNCVLQGHSDAFIDYGQCGRFSETIHSDWWHVHRLSFGTRQLFAYEQGLGWTYQAWKLWNRGEGGSVDYSAVDSPDKLLSLKAVLKAGLLPDLTGDNLWDNMAHACLNPPETDFVMGDATLAPVPAPPPDCWPGWWNSSINDCTYWVAPPTDAPVGCPVCAECDDSNSSGPIDLNQVMGRGDNVTNTLFEPTEMSMHTAALMGPSALYGSKNTAVTVMFSFAAGAVVALLLMSVWNKRRRYHRYEVIPNSIAQR